MNKQKHLEMIQSVINRMAQNSFMIKGWCLTLIVALFALIKDSLNYITILVSIISIIFFGFLDAYYLMLERRYRKLFDIVREKKENDIDYNMETPKGYKNENTTYFQALFSKSIIFYYGALIIIYICIGLCIIIY